MRQLETRADWLLEQSQQHFQKLASLAVRAEGAQRMGKLAARQDTQPLVAGFSKIGRVNPSLTKTALNPISMAKSLIGGAKTIAQSGVKAGKVAVPKPSSIVGAAKGVAKPPAAAPIPSTAVVRPAAPAGATPGRAVAPAAPVPAQAGGAGRLAGASAPPPSRGPATNLFAKQTGDSQSIVSAKRMAEVTGRSPVDEYARMLEQAGYSTGMGGSTGASAARSLATGAATPGAKAGRTAVPSRVSAPPPTAAPVASTPSQSALSPTAGGAPSGAPRVLATKGVPNAPAPSPASSVGTIAAPTPLRTAGTIAAPTPLKAGGGAGQLTPQGPVTAPAPVANAPQSTGRVRGKQSLDERIAHSRRAGEMRDAMHAEDMAAMGITPEMMTAAGRTSGGAGALVGEATQQAAGQAAGQVGGLRGMLGRVPAPVKYLPHAVVGGGGLALGGLALGGGAAMQQSNAPYRYGGGSPMPGHVSYQM